MQRNTGCDSNQAALTDQDRMEDLLSQEKYLISSYSTFIPEASCPQLRQALTANLTDCLENQYTVFDQMSQKGWYPTKPAALPEVEAARQKFAQLRAQMG